MPRISHTPRHLDDPIKPVMGMTVLQTFGALIAMVLGGGILVLTNPLGMGPFLMIRVLLAGSVAAAVFFGAYMLSGERVEPLLQQAIGFSRRARRYVPSAPKR